MNSRQDTTTDSTIHPQLDQNIQTVTARKYPQGAKPMPPLSPDSASSCPHTNPPPTVEAAAFKQNFLRVEKEKFATATGINPGKSSEQRKTSKNAAVLFRPFLCHFSGGPGNQQKAKLNWQLAATRSAKWPFLLVIFKANGALNKLK